MRMRDRMSSSMSLRAVSRLQWAILAHLEVVRIPSMPSRRMLTTMRWRSLRGMWAMFCQNPALSIACWTVVSALVSERSALKEPCHPFGDVGVASAVAFESPVVVGAVLAYLVGHAVDACLGVFRSCQGHVGDGPGDAAVAVLEGVYGDEPKVGLTGAEDPVGVGGLVEPFQECVHLRRHPVCLGCLEVDAFASNGS